MKTKPAYRGRNDTVRFPQNFGGETRTKGSFKEQCDINNIMAQYKRTGLVSHLRSDGAYENLPDSFDYQTATNMVIAARSAFEALPAATRARFQNEPAALLQFLQDPVNREEAVKLGLVNKPDPVSDLPPVPASPVTPPK